MLQEAVSKRRLPMSFVRSYSAMHAREKVFPCVVRWDAGCGGISECPGGSKFAR
jgi:hypothetical protein